MYLIKITHPYSGAFQYLSKYMGWVYNRKAASRFKAEEVILKYQDIAAGFRTSHYTIELERVED